MLRPTAGVLADGVSGDGEGFLQCLVAAPCRVGNFYPARLEVGPDKLQREIAERHLLPIMIGRKARKPETEEYQF